MNRAASPDHDGAATAPGGPAGPLARGLLRLAWRPHLPRRTVRLRLTLLYGALFILSGAALEMITYLLVQHSTRDVLYVHGQLPGANPSGVLSPNVPIGQSLQALIEQAQALRRAAAAQHSRELHQLLIESALALAIMAVVSLVLGWLLAGRVLRPLRTMTATTTRISEHSLDQRLALHGPSDELKDLADTIDGLLGRLETAFDAERRFVANASHELRTPLTMMRTSLDVATGKPGRSSPDLSALEPKLRQGLDQADRLVESFLALARAQHGALAERTPVSLQDTAGEALAAGADAIAARELAVEAELCPAPVTGNRTLLDRMAQNLIDNAIRHNRPAGWIRVRTGLDGDGMAELVVASGGRPLTQDEVRDLVLPFHRLGGSRRDSELGVGMGLAIVSAIALAHGGTIALEPHPWGGLRVTVAIPATGEAG